MHRDIKPANVVLVPAPTGGEPILAGVSPDAPGLSVKLGDFGLGKVHDEIDAADPLTQLTRTGARIGTPAWMAPEQVDRSVGSIGPATDVHALGLLLDRLLTGRSLRGGTTDTEIYRQVLIDEPVSADRVVRGVPRDLAAVAAKCLARQPAARYATADDLAADLDRWLAGRWLVRRTHGEKEILLTPAAGAADSTRPRDLYAIALAPDGATAAVAGADGSIHILRGLDGQPTITAVAAHDEVNDVAFSPDGSLLASAGQDGRLRWWRLTSDGLVAIGETRPGTGPLCAAAWSPDGTLVAVGARTGAVHLFEAATGAGLGQFAPHERAIEGLAFSREGRILVSADETCANLRRGHARHARRTAAGVQGPHASRHGRRRPALGRRPCGRPTDHGLGPAVGHEPAQSLKTHEPATTADERRLPVHPSLRERGRGEGAGNPRGIQDPWCLALSRHLSLTEPDRGRAGGNPFKSDLAQVTLPAGVLDRDRDDPPFGIQIDVQIGGQFPGLMSGGRADFDESRVGVFKIPDLHRSAPESLDQKMRCEWSSGPAGE